MDESSIPGLVSPSIRSTISLSLYLPPFLLCIPPTPPFSKHLLHPRSLAKALQLPECIHESGNHRIDRWCASLEFQSAWPAAGTGPFFCLANGGLNESGSGISRLICVASKLPEKARRHEPSPAQLHAFCSQDYDRRDIYAHIIWDVVQRERERERVMRNGALRDTGDEDTAGWEGLHIASQQMHHLEVWPEIKVQRTTMCICMWHADSGRSKDQEQCKQLNK